MTETKDSGALEVVRELEAYIERAVKASGGDTSPLRPSHRVPFHWPPHPVSYDYHVLPSDWSSRTQIEMHGEPFDVEIAKTAVGVFGRCETLWNEARGVTMQEMLDGLKAGCEPYFKRQFAIATTLERDGRFKGTLQELAAADLVKLLYCTDRDVAHEAHTIIETRASTGLFSYALVEVVKDERHPARRIAQWCALDMFEDLPAYFPEADKQTAAIDAIKSLIWSASDDYARTIYKAGVVLGGHICTEPAADALIACVTAPSKYGRRSAIHACFHLAEWMPSRRNQTIEALRAASENDAEPSLREFARCMVRDIGAGAVEHVTEPIFSGE